MAKRKYPFLCSDRDRKGNLRWYVRMTGKPKVRIREEFGTPAFMAAYAAGLKGIHTPLPGARVEKQPAVGGSLRSLCERYYKSPEMVKLENSTRRVRRSVLERLCQETTASGKIYGNLPFKDMRAHHIRSIRDQKQDKPGAANSMVKALRQLFTFAIANNLADSNPAKDVPYFSEVRVGGIPAWSTEDVQQFAAAHPAGTMARLALLLFIEFGQRISDIHRLGSHMVKGDSITFTQHKNRKHKPVTLTLPISEMLQGVLDDLPEGQKTFLVTGQGQPFASTASFGNKFRDWCLAAGLKDRSAHGLRKYFSAQAAERGCTDREIMAFTGHSTSKEVDRYTRSASQTKMAQAAARKHQSADIVPPISGASQNGTKPNSKSLSEKHIEKFVVPGDGVEPPTLRFSIACSTN